MTKVAISQPTYLPWLGYIKMIQSVDIFVFLDNVQFEKQSWQSRNRIKNDQDLPIWLSIPVETHSLETKICDIKISSNKNNWKRKHLNSIQTYLGKTPYLHQVISLLESSFAQPHKYLADLNIDITCRLCEQLNIKTQLIRASETNASGKNTDLLLEILQELKSDHYLANAGSKSYLDSELNRFTRLGIKMDYHQWSPPTYSQRGKVFIDRLAWIDPVAYLGFDTKRLLG